MPEKDVDYHLVESQKLICAALGAIGSNFIAVEITKRSIGRNTSSSAKNSGLRSRSKRKDPEFISNSI